MVRGFFRHREHLSGRKKVAVSRNVGATIVLKKDGQPDIKTEARSQYEPYY